VGGSIKMDRRPIFIATLRAGAGRRTPNPSHCANFFAYSHCRYLAGFFKDTENDYSNHGWRPEHMFRPDRKQRRRYSLDERKEADFPSLTVVEWQVL
jgi:hypothetical protein